MKHLSTLGKLVVLLLAAPVVRAQVRPLPVEAVPVAVEVPYATGPVQAMGKSTLVYELHLTNFEPTALALDEVQVTSDDARAAPLASYQRAEIARQLIPVSYGAAKPAPAVIGSGQRAILLCCSAPRLPFRACGTGLFSGRPPTQLLPPGRCSAASGLGWYAKRRWFCRPRCKAAGWLAGNGLSNSTEHRRSVKVLNGHPYIAQRFATDWIQVGADGLLARHGDMSRKENYYGYGANVLAAAPATVLAVQDSIPENDAPQTRKRAVPITLRTIADNYVLLDLGKGHYALYGHLQPHRLRVNPGDRVQVGQVLGQVGNSGNSSLPHLHFQVVNAASPLAAEGISYVLSSFQLQGIAEVNATLVKNGFKPTGNAQRLQLEIPVQNAVVVLP